MQKSLLALIALSLSLPLLAQENAEAQRADHYLDHLVLGIDDLERGMDEIQRMTGVRPKFDGRDPYRGTHSAVIGLGEDAFIEIVAPDPKADAADLDPALKALFFDRLAKLDALTPFSWAVGTKNLEQTKWLARRVYVYVSDFEAGTRKRGWGRGVDWTWARVERPESRVMPLLVQWNTSAKRPQDRAPAGCTLTELRIESRIFKSVQALLVALQIEADPVGSDDESLRFTLDCKGKEVVFEPVSLVEIQPVPGLPNRREDGANLR